MSSTSWRSKPVPFSVVAAVAWGLCAAQAAAGSGDGPGFCPFRAVTGHACPGCGMGRAVVAAMSGRWAESWAFHPLGMPLLAVWTGWLLWEGWKSARQRHVHHAAQAVRVGDARQRFDAAA